MTSVKLAQDRECQNSIVLKFASPASLLDVLLGHLGEDQIRLIALMGFAKVFIFICIDGVFGDKHQTFDVFKKLHFELIHFFNNNLISVM